MFFVLFNVCFEQRAVRFSPYSIMTERTNRTKRIIQYVVPGTSDITLVEVRLSDTATTRRWIYIRGGVGLAMTVGVILNCLSLSPSRILHGSTTTTTTQPKYLDKMS